MRSVTNLKFRNVSSSLEAGRSAKWVEDHYHMSCHTVALIREARGSYSRYCRLQSVAQIMANGRKRMAHHKLKPAKPSLWRRLLNSVHA